MKYLIILSLLLASCAGPKIKKEIEQEKSQVTSKQMEMTSNNVFTKAVLNSKTLTQEQKNKLLEIQKKVDTRTAEIDEEIKKLKVLLYENLAKKDGSDKKMNILVRQLKKLYYERVDIMSNAFYDIKTIIGRNSMEKYHQMWWYGMQS